MKEHTNTKAMVLAALFTALTAVGAFLQIPLGFTSITLQTLFTWLAGLLLGPKWGALSQLAYVVLGLVGLPIFTQGGGLGYLVKPSMGFLIGLIPMAWIVGMLTRDQHSPKRVVLACVAADVVLYLLALPYMYCVLNLYLGMSRSVIEVVEGGMLLFLPGDAVKIAVAAAISGPITRTLNHVYKR